MAGLVTVRLQRFLIVRFICTLWAQRHTSFVMTGLLYLIRTRGLARHQETGTNKHQHAIKVTNEWYPGGLQISLHIDLQDF